MTARWERDVRRILCVLVCASLGATCSKNAAPSPTALTSMPTVESFESDKSAIADGQSVTLEWSVSNAMTVKIDNGVGPVTASGQLAVTPAASTTYTLVATNFGGSTTRSVSIAVTPPR
jgi:hypothetical protein